MGSEMCIRDRLYTYYFFNTLYNIEYEGTCTCTRTAVHVYVYGNTKVSRKYESTFVPSKVLSYFRTFVLRKYFVRSFVSYYSTCYDLASYVLHVLPYQLIRRTAATVILISRGSEETNRYSRGSVFPFKTCSSSLLLKVRMCVV